MHISLDTGKRHQCFIRNSNFYCNNWRSLFLLKYLFMYNKLNYFAIFDCVIQQYLHGSLIIEFPNIDEAQEEEYM